MSGSARTPERGRGRILGSEEVFDGRVVRLRVEEVELPSGRRTKLELVAHPGAAAVVPLAADGTVLMVRQYRHAARGEWLLEVPAGKLDPGESPERCARRECEEETGYRPATLEPLGFVWTTPGFTDERIWLYLARGLEPGRQDLQPDEALEVEAVPLAEAVRRALVGGVDDGKSIAALLRAAAHLGVVPSPGSEASAPG